MCTICGSSNCSSSRATQKTIYVYGNRKKYVSNDQREYLGTVTVNTWDNSRTIRMKVFAKYPDWQEYSER